MRAFSCPVRFGGPPRPPHLFVVSNASYIGGEAKIEATVIKHRGLGLEPAPPNLPPGDVDYDSGL